jgi:glycosyltransferase involved in cell wall biosynthesis
VLPRLAPGGMERLVIQLAGDASDHGDAVAVASGPGAWVSKIAQAGAEHVALPTTSRRSVHGLATATVRLARCIEHRRPDVVHAHNVRATSLAWLALAAARHPAVLLTTLHGVSPGDYRRASRILRRIAPRVITCTPSVSRSLEAAGFPGARIEVITNGAAMQPAGPQRQEELRQRLRLDPGPLVVGIGRLEKQKNWPAFIAAARLVSGPQFAVAGEGPLDQELKDLARRSGNRVRILGPVDDIAALVGLADCVVSTSSWEGLPLSLLEALSVGAAVVTTAVDGISDVVPPDAALFVAPEDPAAVSAAISRILTDTELAGDLRRQALAAAANFRPELMLRRYRSAYQAACADSDARSLTCSQVAASHREPRRWSAPR